MLFAMPAQGLFQSSLGPRGPSVLVGALAAQAAAEFQSSLGPRGPSVLGLNFFQQLVISFNPRSALAGRASSASTRVTRPLPCFNPRSALAGRASEEEREAGREGSVSILARPSRAERPNRPLDKRGLKIVSILARPSRAERQVSRIALSRKTKPRTLREPSCASLVRSAFNLTSSDFHTRNHEIPFAANLPDISGHLRSARHKTIGPSKSTALKFPYSRT